MLEFHFIFRVTWTNCAKSNKISPWELTPRVKKSAITWEISFPFCWIRASPSRTRLGSFSFISSQRTVNLRLDFQRLSFVRLETSRSFSNLVDEVKVKFVEVPESKSVFRVLTIFFSNFGMVFSQDIFWSRKALIFCFLSLTLGISEENFTKLIQHAQIPNEDREMITNLQLVGCNVVVDVSDAISMPLQFAS